MKISTTSKFVAGVVSLSLALTIFVGAGVSTAGAQAMTLSQLVDLFISLGIIAPDKAAAAKAAVTGSTTSTGYNYTRDLTIGSTGADVTALQNALGVTPATGYFGTLTAAAVKSYQASKGIPSTGYFGPLTRAEINKSAGSTTTGGSTTTPVVNSGVEGILTVNRSSVPNTTAYEGESMRTILAFKAEAKLSDINIQRVKLDLGTETKIYTKIYRTMYLVDDAGRVLAQANLNSNTVVKNSGKYELTLGGFSYNIPKDSSRILTVKADLYSSIDSNDRSGSKTITLPEDGVRGIDGAGIDQYAPGASLSQSMSINASLIESAALKLSTNSANFKTAEVIAAEGSEDNEYDKLSLLSFDLRAEKDDVLITDLTVNITKTGTGSATTTTVYLMDGSNVIDSEDLNGAASVTFDDLDYTIARDTTKTLTVRADIRDANAETATFVASVSANGIFAENSEGDNVSSKSGSATGESMIVRNIGPVVTLVSKNISKSQSAEIGNSSTTTVKASFDIRLRAVGNDIAFGPSSNASSTFNFATYKNGSKTVLATASTTSFTVPSTGVVSHATGSFTVQENNEVTVPVEFVFVGNSLDLGSYAVGLESVKWGTSVASSSLATTDFMAGNLDWRTSTIQLP